MRNQRTKSAIASKPIQKPTTNKVYPLVGQRKVKSSKGSKTLSQRSKEREFRKYLEEIEDPKYKGSDTS